jgi:hypothetical protein
MSDQEPLALRLYWYSHALVMTIVAVDSALTSGRPWNFLAWLAATFVATGAAVSAYRDLRQAKHTSGT